MGKSSSRSICLVAFLLFSMFGGASAQVRVPGVSQGSYFLYEATIHWNSTDPTASCPQIYEDYNSSITRFSVTHVVGTVVTWEATRNLQNGSYSSYSGDYDVETGESSNEEFLANIFVVAADLSVNDSLYPWNTGYPVTINETVPRAYLDTNRDTNVARLNGSIDQPTSAESELWYDKRTGVLVYYSVKYLTENGAYTETRIQEIRIIESNIWTVPEFPSIPILLLFMITALLTALICRKNTLKRRKLQTVEFIHERTIVITNSRFSVISGKRRDIVAIKKDLIVAALVAFFLTLTRFIIPAKRALRVPL